MDKIKGSMLRVRQANMFVQMKIANILDYDFINLKSFKPRWQKFDVKKAVSEVIDIIQIMNSEEKEFVLRLYESTRSICSDKERIQQVLLSLLQKALQSSQIDGKVILEVHVKPFEASVLSKAVSMDSATIDLNDFDSILLFKVTH